MREVHVLGYEWRSRGATPPARDFIASQTAPSRCIPRPMDYPPPIFLWPSWRRTTGRFGWNNCGGLSRFDGKRFKTYSEKDGLLNSCVGAWRKTLTTIFGLAPGVADSSVFATATSPSIRLHKGCPV